MLMDVPKIQIADWLKLSPQQFFTLFLFAAIALGLLTFASDGLLENLGLRDFRSDYLLWLGLGLILAFAGLVAFGGAALFQWARKEYRRRRALSGGQKRLHSLTAEEQAVLTMYIGT